MLKFEQAGAPPLQARTQSRACAQMFLSARTCRELGLFLLACRFHGPAQTTTLTLRHPESDIRRIVITADEVTLADPPIGLSMKPFALDYIIYSPLLNR